MAILTKEIGDWGEDIAIEWLRDNGFELLHRNWRNGRYELDAVAQKGDTIHFVEVKCRKMDGLTAPVDAITSAKFKSLAKAAEAYIAYYNIDLEVQFDLIAVEYKGEKVHVEYVPEAMVAQW